MTVRIDSKEGHLNSLSVVEALMEKEDLDIIELMILNNLTQAIWDYEEREDVANPLRRH